MEETYLLEINLISAQNLKPPTSNLRRMQTYALTYIDPSVKLRTRIDRIGGESPTWNDKFIFRVSPAFLSSETSAVSVEIYSVGYLKDPLVGSVRFLVKNCLREASVRSGSVIGLGIPSFSALQIRRSSGRFHGVLNIGTMVINGADTSFLTGISAGTSAIGYQDLMGGGEAQNARKKTKSRRRKKEERRGNDENYCENNSSLDTGEFSDSNSSCSSMSSTTSTAFKDWNGGGRREMMRSEGSSGMLCGLGFPRKDSSESVRSELAD